MARVFVASSLLVLINLSAVAGGTSDLPPGFIDDDPEDCTEAIPEQTSVTGITDDGREVVLDVYVLLDGVEVQRGTEVMEKVQRAYEPLEIAIRATYRNIDIPHQRMEPEFIGGEPEPVSDVSYLFEKTKEAVGGERPPNTDVVYLMTSDRITGTTAGVADCIGGIRYPNRAFAIGEEEADNSHSTTLNFCCTWTSAKIAGHEIGHLLGAHHHYANCAEGTPEAVEDRHMFTCTLMFNDVGAINLRFSTLEGAVVRGHVLEYGDRPPEPYERTLDLELTGHLVAKGRLNAGEATFCSEAVDVRLERRSDRQWTTVRHVETSSDGSFRSRIPDRAGRYRAFAPESSEEDGEGESCSAAVSTPVRHRH